MSQIKFQKVVSSLPEPLDADTIYFVREGLGFDMVLTNKTGAIAAYSLNPKKPVEADTPDDIPADAPLHQEYLIMSGAHEGKTFRVFDVSTTPHKAGEIAIAGQFKVGLNNLAQEVLDAIAAGGGNLAPTANPVNITGTATVGQTLTGTYTFDDLDDDAEGASIFQWYRANDNSGTGEAAISGSTATTYVLTSADAGKYIRFGVIPVSATGATTGTETFSAYLSAIANYTPTAPIVSANDATDTIDAEHALGDSEIMVSINNGAYTQFDGTPISVGNVARALGYYKFKIKSAAGRNESPVASSPEFTTSGGAGAGNVSWTGASAGTNTTSPDIYRASGNYNGAESVETINAGSGAPSYFEMRPPVGEARLGGPYTSMYLVPAATVVEHGSVDPTLAITGEAGHMRGFIGEFPFSPANVQVGNINAGNVADCVYRIGFNASGQFTCTNVTTAETYTRTAESFTGNFKLVVAFANLGGSNQLSQVKYQQ